MWEYLCTSAEVRAASLHAVLDDEEAGQLCDEVLVALQEVRGRRQVGVQLQPPVALVGLLEFRQLPQTPVHLRAPAQPHQWLSQPEKPAVSLECLTLWCLFGKPVKLHLGDHPEQ